MMETDEIRSLLAKHLLLNWESIYNLGGNLNVKTLFLTKVLTFTLLVLMQYQSASCQALPRCCPWINLYSLRYRGEVI